MTTQADPTPTPVPATPPAEPATPATPAAATPPATPAPPAEPKDDELKDKHGQPAISKGKYERDMQEKDTKITELEGKLTEMSKTAEGRDALQKEINDLKGELASEKKDHELSAAGCVNVKAAKALLEDFDSIDAMKAACPYLFDIEKPIVSSGGAPGGVPITDEQTARYRKSMGLKESE